MNKKTLGVALSAPLMACFMASATAANQGQNAAVQQNAAPHCELSGQAVTNLPAPLERWAKIICTRSGHVITGRDGWVWLEPNNSALVVIPSQAFGAHVETGGSSYFTKIELTKVSGEEFEKAYEVFHTGFDPKDAKPAGYRLDVETMAGNEIRLYIFDYFTYGWGMACSKEACDASSRFVMLNMKVDPKPLEQPI